MPFKPNYNMQRADRERGQRAKREEKLRQRQERSAERKAVASAASDAGQRQGEETPASAGQPGEAGRKD